MIHEADDISMCILKMYTGLKNKATLRVNIQRNKQKVPGKRIELITYSASN